jgi:hypothetical protein
LQRQYAEGLSEMPSQLPVKRLPTVFGNEHNMIFDPPCCGLSFHTRPS